MEAKDYISRLIEILVKKQALLQEISGFTRLQKEALLAENYNELEILIAKKQARIDAIDKLDEQFSVYSERLKSIVGVSSFDELPQYHIPGTKELKENVAKVFGLLNEIKALESENTGKMNAEISILKDKIKQTNSFKKVNTAYNSPRPVINNHYFDTKK